MNQLQKNLKAIKKRASMMMVIDSFTFRISISFVIFVSVMVISYKLDESQNKIRAEELL